MKPLFVLLSTFILSIIIIKLVTHQYDLLFAARISMCIMLFFTAIAHFAFTKGMSMMIPPFVPFKTELVYVTGILEIILGIGLLMPDFKVYSAWALIVFFIFLLPANIYAAINHIDYQKGTFNGNGTSYLWFRVPLQVFFILWIYLSAIKIW
ncbi:hypothetical protein LNQ49_22155 [Flavobacterium sp. F-65]|uniref:DoxX protein n=1 Tax=Flavobacterium pisciphilum TaxID=2893755 RepID=A0ABS8MZV9_9FLAO|nr:hypothetical protein [Flavobacterium sp. F-65]MCC9074300.1 hypothetical protein [Flavobacterium sp. F-65]